MSETMKFIEGRILQYLQVSKRIWTYQGTPNPNQPHARLTTGLCSNGFVDVGTLLKDYPQTRENISKFILEALAEIWQGHFTRVVGADTSSTDLAWKIANMMNVEHITMMKTVTGDQMWHPRNEPLVDGDVILHVEDVITTAGSSLKVRNAIRARYPNTNVQFVTFLPVVVDRSDPDNRITIVEDSKILPLLQLDIKTFQPEECPYCKAGSKAIRPREGNNWYLLTKRV